MDIETKEKINAIFPGLQYEITSPHDDKYNCIAWAAEEDHRFWWPDSQNTAHWPEEIERKNTLGNFISAFNLLGYYCCDTLEYEEGYEKIAIFISNDNNKPTHAARQINSKLWASKLGASVDIEHTIESLIGGYYGNVGVVMKRPRQAT